MVLTDPIADFLTRIRNAQMARKDALDMPFSQMKFHIGQVMVKNKFLAKCERDDSGKFPVLHLELMPEKKIELSRVSKPGQRIYTKAEDIRKVKNGFGIAVLSTSQGIMTGYEARKKNMGGELLCTIS